MVDESEQNKHLDYTSIDEFEQDVELDIEPVKRVSVTFDNIKLPPLPKKPPSVYFIFYKHCIETRPEQFKGLNSFNESSLIVAQEWKKLDEMTRKKYFKAYEIEMDKYKALMRQYYNSPEFQQYQMHRSCLEQKVERDENEDYLTNKPGMLKQSVKHYLQSSKDVNEDIDSQSLKRISSINFYKNMFLMEKIFDGTLLGEIRSQSAPKDLDEDTYQRKKEKMDLIEEEIAKQSSELDELKRQQEEELHSIKISNDKMSQDPNFFPQPLRHFQQDTLEKLQSLSKEELASLKEQVLMFKC